MLHVQAAAAGCMYRLHLLVKWKALRTAAAALLEIDAVAAASTCCGPVAFALQAQSVTACCEVMF